LQLDFFFWLTGQKRIKDFKIRFCTCGRSWHAPFSWLVKEIWACDVISSIF